MKKTMKKDGDLNFTPKLLKTAPDKAYKAMAKPKMMAKPELPVTVYIGNLDYDRDERDLKKLFSYYGEVHSVSVVLDPETEKSKGIAFVKMGTKKEADAAVKGLNGLRYDERTLKCSIANDRFASIDAERESRKMAVRAPNKPASEREERVRRPAPVKKQGLDVLFNYLKTKK